MRKLLLMLLALACATAYAAEAKIEGPDESLAGDLIVLTSKNTQADVKQWIIPTTLEHRYIQTEHQIAFATRDAGEYKFGLVAVEVTGEKTADIDIAVHTVTITGGLCDPVVPDPGDPDDPADPDPTPDPDPDPDPPPATEALKKLSRDSAIKLNDPGTAKLLASVLKSIEGDSIAVLDSRTEMGIEGVLLARKGESRNKDWLSEWRRPVRAAMKSTTPAARIAELNAIAVGLAESIGQTAGPSPPDIAPEPIPLPQKTRVVMHTRANCSHCVRWKTNVLPTLLSWGMQFEPVQSDGDVPIFEVIQPSGQRTTMIGYQDAIQFRKFL